MKKIILVIVLVLINLNFAFSAECVNYERDKKYLRELLEPLMGNNTVSEHNKISFEKCIASGIDELLNENKIKCKNNLKYNFDTFLKVAEKRKGEDYVDEKMMDLTMSCYFKNMF